LILIAIALPSFALLYAMDDVGEPTLTIKVVGHQWYWSYEVVTAEETNFVSTDSDAGSTFYGPLTEADTIAAETAKAEGPELTRKAFDSYMLLEDDLELGQHRLLEVDNSLVLPS